MRFNTILFFTFLSIALTYYYLLKTKLTKNMFLTFKLFFRERIEKDYPRPNKRARVIHENMQE